MWYNLNWHRNKCTCVWIVEYKHNLELCKLVKWVKTVTWKIVQQFYRLVDANSTSCIALLHDYIHTWSCTVKIKLEKKKFRLRCEEGVHGGSPTSTYKVMIEIQSLLTSATTRLPLFNSFLYLCHSKFTRYMFMYSHIE